MQTGLAIAPRHRTPLGGRLFDGLRFVDAARVLALAALVFTIAWYGLRAILPALAVHAGKSVALLADSSDAASRIAWTSIACAVAFAAGDVVLRRAAWIRRLSPSPEEQKRERRETEGAPEPRRARRRAHENLVRSD